MGKVNKYRLIANLEKGTNLEKNVLALIGENNQSGLFSVKIELVFVAKTTSLIIDVSVVEYSLGINKDKNLECSFKLNGSDNDNFQPVLLIDILSGLNDYFEGKNIHQLIEKAEKTQKFFLCKCN